MKIKVSSSYSGVIATGSYENSRPAFSAEVECEADDNFLNDIPVIQKQLHEICYGQFKSVEQEMVVERINKERKDIRFRKAPNGKLYPSLTSVLNYDADFMIPDYQLQQYASQSNICHARTANFISTGKWVEPKDLKECHTDIVICVKGDLGLDIDAGSFPNFLEDFPILDMENGTEIYDDELEICGLPDFMGVPDIDKGKWKKVFPEIKKVKSVFDVKRSVDEEKNLCQVFGYGKPLGIKQGVIIPLNNKTKQGYSQPLVSQKHEYYIAILSNKRKSFRGRFGC
jgi:hypothetical protein